jgi:glycosyl transferase family 2
MIVAIVPAKDRADSVGATVRALRAVRDVDRVLVVDDGSVDATAAEARAAGADVLRLPVNRGKSGAVAAGVAACPEADVLLLIDADVGASASAAACLLAPVVAGDADLVVGVMPGAGRAGGVGTVRRLARTGIRRACGATVDAPLCGQRAVRAAYLRDLDPGGRFGLEVAMTIDAVRSGARLVEVEVPMDHRHTGRTLRGFAHRGRQGVDVVEALWPRVTSARARMIGVVLVALLVCGAMVWSSAGRVPASVAAGPGVDRVVLVGVPHLALDDVGTGALPALDGLVHRGAAGATNVRTLSGRPSSGEAYATLGAGARVQDGHPGLGTTPSQALPAGAAFEGGTAAQVTARRSGRPASGEIVLPAAPVVVRSAGEHVSSTPGALGEALSAAGLTTAVVSNGDSVAPDGTRVPYRPAALAAVDAAGTVDAGTVDPDELLVADPAEPYGLRADVGAYLRATHDALARSDLVVVDLGDMNRAAWQARVTASDVAEADRGRALGRVDEYLAGLVPELDAHTLLLVVSVRPDGRDWDLTPTVAYGAGVTPGSLHSPSTQREGLVTLTDVAPTILAALGADRPAGMIGHALRYRSEPFDMASARRLNDLAGSREQIYYPMALTFIVVQVLAYVFAAVVLSQRGGRRAGSALRLTVLTFAAWPLATFLERAVPGIERVGAARQVLVWLLAGAVAVLASRARRHALAPLSAIAGATALLLVVDVATGARLQMASVLGYSPHTAARYEGFGNTAFAVLAACAVVFAAVHVASARRRGEAAVTAGAVLAVVLLADVWPTLGADVGGILTMVPVFGLLMLALSGRRISWRQVVVFGAATLAVLAVVAGVDLVRPPSSRGHLGRFTADLISGDGTALTTIERKWATNVRLFGRTVWTWMVPLTAGFMLYVLVIARGWQRLLPPGSALRAGVIGTIGAGLLGWLVNDSGVVVSGLVFVFVGPYLTLLALDRLTGPPELLAASDPAAGPAAPPA